MAKINNKKTDKKVVKGTGPKLNNSFLSTFVSTILIILVIVSLYSVFDGGKNKETLSISELASSVRLGNVKEIKIKKKNMII